MRNGILVVSLAMLAGLSAGAQSTPAPAPGATCTDLSRTVVVPCPDPEGNSAPPSADKPAAATPQPEKPAASAEPRQPSAPDVVPSVKKEAGTAPAASGAPPETPSQPEAAPLPARTRDYVRSSLAFAYSPASLRNVPRNLVIDQRNFWTSPARVRPHDLWFILPFAGATAGLLANDTTIEKHLPTSTTLIQRSKSFGTYGAAAFAGAAGGAFLLGKLQDNAQLSETGMLSGEAAVTTLLATYGLKYAAGRQRPLEGNGQGDFRKGGVSFPSEHSAAAWAIASVVAHEYPGPLTEFLTYGAAGAMTASRVLGRQHFASDALVASGLGWFIGRQVYRAHQSGGGDTEQFGTFIPAPKEPGSRDPAYMASTYVPLDSWVYSAFDRLIARGYVKTGFLGLRPWTRMECARLLDEADTRLGDDSPNEARATYDALAAEFGPEQRRRDGAANLGATLESVYARYTGISGAPLRDSYNFGQTIIDEYGRPYGEGSNAVTGITGRVEAGPFAIYIAGEFQHAPGSPALPDAARLAVSQANQVPLRPALGQPEINRFRPIQAYAMLQVSNWQLAFGWQSLWWGPGGGSPMLLSNNAEPFPMLKISRAEPFEMPWPLRFLGPVRVETFLGQLQGHDIVFRSGTGYIGQFGRSLDPQPFIHGEKISFKPTENLEFSLSRTTLFAGAGVPFTSRILLKSLFSTGNANPGTTGDPGDRRSAIDFTYRLPGLRNWLTWYADGFNDDEFSPLAYADRAAWRSGLYMPQVPGLPKLDFRAEGVFTDLPIGGRVAHGFFYYNDRYLNGYTNRGELLGSWIGRQGQGAQAWSTYHLNARNYVQVGFRHQKVSPQFMTSGGTLTDASVRSDYWIAPYLSVSGLLQYEKWRFPVLAPGPESNVVGSFQVTFWPAHRSDK